MGTPSRTNPSRHSDFWRVKGNIFGASGKLGPFDSVVAQQTPGLIGRLRGLPYTFSDLRLRVPIPRSPLLCPFRRMCRC